MDFTLKNDRWTTEARLTSWQDFLDRGGPYAAKASEAPSDGWTRIVFAPDSDRGPEPLTADEIASVQWLVDNEAAVGAALLSALLIEYPKIKKVYGDFAADQGRPMPEVSSANGLRRLIGLNGVYVHMTKRDGIPYIGFLFGCTWDGEHGLGVLMHGTRAVEIGNATTAFLAWIAEGDAATS